MLNQEKIAGSGTCSLNGIIRWAADGVLHAGKLVRSLLLFLACSLWSSWGWAQCTNCTTTTVGADTVHRFTASGTFTPPPGVTAVRYLVVGGGGGGGGITNVNAGGAGGGGAGGYRAATGFAVTPGTSYTITVGAGGAGAACSGGTCTAGSNGGNSVFSSITATGGGRGGYVGNNVGTAGGSGGGGRLDTSGTGGAGTSGQGNNGGNGNATGNGGAGGGGASAGGGNANTNNTGGAGGAGTSNNITGTAVTYAGGGGGGGYGAAGGAGGAGGGGSAPASRGAGGNATANTGGGGGGATGSTATTAHNGGNGGSGVVVIRYTTPPANYYSRNGGGNWSATATWSNTGCNGTAGSTIPHADATVTICNNDTVTLNQNATIAELIVGSGNNNSTLTHTGSNALTTGGVTFNRGTGGTKAWNVNAGSATVNGNVVMGNWTAGTARIALTSGTLDINGDLGFFNNTLGQAVIDASGGAANIFLSGAMTDLGNARILPGTASTFTYDGGNQSVWLGVGDINYHNLTLAGSGTKQQQYGGAATVGGATTVNAGVTFTNSGAVTFSGAFVNNGTTNASQTNDYQSSFTNAGTYTSSAGGGQNYRGNFSNSGTFTPGSAQHRFNGSALQTLTGATTFQNLEVNNSAGLVINSNVTVTMQATLTSGVVTTGANVFIVQQTTWSGVSRGSGYINGNLRLRMPTGGTSRVFDVGGANGYRPVTVAFANITTQGDLTVSVSDPGGDHPDIGTSSIDPAKSVNRWWTLTNGGIAFSGNYSVVFNFLAGDVDGGANPAQFNIQRHSGGTWNDVTAGTRTGTSTQGTGLDAFGTFAVGERMLVSTCPAGGELVSGLFGSYYNVTGGFPPARPSGLPDGTRVDGPVNFNWAAAAPGVPGIGINQFSVRWDGYIYVETSGNYRFQTQSDDGVRLWVNDMTTPIIDNWTDHSSTTNTSGTVALTAGQFYPIRFEFYENGGDAVIQLRWEPPAGSFVAIPAGPLPTPGAGLYHCSEQQVPGLLAHYTMDEAAWNGTTGEVKDSSGNNRHGTALAPNGPTTANTAPARPGNPGTCGYGVFDGSNDYVTVPNLQTILGGTASLAFWIRTTQAGSNTAWEAPGVTGVEESGGGNDVFWGFLRGNGRIAIQKGNGAYAESAAAVNNGNWQHVVLTRNTTTGAVQVYLNGSLSGSATGETGAVTTAFSSIGRIEDTGGTPVYFNGQIDEMRVYDRVLTAAEVAVVYDLKRPCDVEALDHIRITHGSGSGLTCNPSTLTIRACANVDCTIEYTGGVAGTLTATGATTNFAGGAGFAIASGLGSVNKDIQVTTPGGASIGATGISPAPVNPAPACNFGTPACTFTAADSGFVFDVQDHVSDTLQSNVTVSAVRKDDVTQRCVPAFQSTTKTVGFWSNYLNPATGTLAVSVNGGGIAGASPGTNVNLNFNASGEATIQVRYPDVGRVRLHARHDGSGVAGGLLMLGQDEFVSKPAGFTVSGIQRTADAFANPAAADAAGTAFIRAGENITLTVTARNASNNATPNFGRESPAEGVQLTSALVGGLGLVANPALGNGLIAGTAFTGGAATATNVTWGEVGIITLTPRLGDGDYLGTGDVIGTASGNVGRFIPHNFAVAFNDPAFAAACTAGGFTYVGQPFVYAAGMSPVLTATARNLAGGTTLNYRGTSPASQAFFRITNGSLTGKTYSAASGTLDVSGITGTDPVIVDNGNGTGTLTFNSGSGVAFTRGSPVAPFDADISLAIDVIDADGVAYSSNPARFGQASAGNGIDFPDGKAVRYGRLRLTGASGSQVLPLRVPFEAQYWTGTFFATNTLDTCTTLTAGNVGMDNYIGNLNAGETTVTSVTALSAGRGTIVLGAPGAGNNGSVDLAFNLGNGTAAAACPSFAPSAGAGNLPWLRGQWCGAAHDRDPSARARFGIRGGGGERIYIRENY